MREPFTCGNFHIGKGRFKGGILRTAGINAEGYGSTAIAHMAHTHLLKCDAIAGAFNAIIVLTAAESIPHRFYTCADFCRSPIGITVVCHNGTQMLKILVFVFNRAFDPVLAVKIHHNTALIKSVLAFKFCFHNEREVFLICFHLQHRGIVISEVVVCSLPQVCFGGCDNFNFLGETV